MNLVTTFSTGQFLINSTLTIKDFNADSKVDHNKFS